VIDYWVAKSYRPYHKARRSRLVPELEAAERLKARQRMLGFDRRMVSGIMR
jgi:hypothetical protein